MHFEEDILWNFFFFSSGGSDKNLKPTPLSPEKFLLATGGKGLSGAWYGEVTATSHVWLLATFRIHPPSLPSFLFRGLGPHFVCVAWQYFNRYWFHFCGASTLRVCHTRELLSWYWWRLVAFHPSIQKRTRKKRKSPLNVRHILLGFHVLGALSPVGRQKYTVRRTQTRPQTRGSQMRGGRGEVLERNEQQQQRRRKAECLTFGNLSLFMEAFEKIMVLFIHKESERRRRRKDKGVYARTETRMVGCVYFWHSTLEGEREE